MLQQYNMTIFVVCLWEKNAQSGQQACIPDIPNINTLPAHTSCQQ